MMGERTLMGKKIQKRPTLGPSECAHCHTIWYGQFCHGGENGSAIIPDGVVLCVYCWSALDNYLYQQFTDLYGSERERRKELHEEARKWIADSSQKPLRPKNCYTRVPMWMRLAIEQRLVETNSPYIYTITVLDGMPIKGSRHFYLPKSPLGGLIICGQKQRKRWERQMLHA